MDIDDEPELNFGLSEERPQTFNPKTADDYIGQLLNRKYFSTLPGRLLLAHSRGRKKMRSLFYRIMTLGLTLLLGSGMFLVLMLALQSVSAAQASSSSPASEPRERLAFRFQPTSSVAQVSSVSSAPVVLAEYQVWHGLPNHLVPPPYTSTEPSVISNHIQLAQAQGISGFVVDWYGPPGGFLNDNDRGFMDKAMAELMKQAGPRGFRVALMYDEGTISWTGMPTTTYTTLALNDLLYARKYLTMTAYLTMTRGITTAPAIFVFPYDNVDAYIDWSYVRSHLGIPVILLDENPTSANAVKFDGFYAWVQPASSGWRADGTEWGEDYLKWFYNLMSTTYSNTITIGGVWPGFDDSLASWGSHRYMARRCGQTWLDTWALANAANPPFVMIDTWNDFEEGTFVEGTDIGLGRGACFIPSQSKFASSGATVVYTHTLVNTGKFTDTFNITKTSIWPTVVSTVSLSLPSYSSTTVTITVTVPTVSIGAWDKVIITATSVVSPSMHCSVMDTTTILTPTYKVFLPLISNQKPPPYSISLPGACSPY